MLARTNDSSGGPKGLRTVTWGIAALSSSPPPPLRLQRIVRAVSDRKIGVATPAWEVYDSRPEGSVGPREEAVLMDPRFDNDQSTGTLPGIGPGVMSLRPEPPAWLEETRA